MRNLRNIPRVSYRDEKEGIRRLSEYVRSMSNNLTEIVSVDNQGASGNGTTDDRSGFVSADTEAFVIPPGTYSIQSDLTITNDMTFMPGGILKPASGVEITINGAMNEGLWQRFDLSAGGSITGLKRANVIWFGATDGIADDTAAIVSAFVSLSIGSTLLFPPGNYSITTVSVTLPSRATILAYGATITCTTDAIGIEINATASTQLPMIRWNGGYFKNTAVAKTASIGLKIQEVRNIVIKNARFDSFWKGVEYIDRDTFIFNECHFFDNEFGIYLNENASLGTWGALITTVDNCHFSINGKTAGFYAEGLWANINITNSSFNGSAINSIYANNNHTNLLQMRGFRAEGNHFEQGAAGDIYIKLHDSKAGVGTYAFLGIVINSNTFGDDSPDAVVLQNAQNITFEGNSFAQVAGLGTPITLDANCVDINIGRSNRFSTALVSYSCARSEITFGPERRNQTHFPITGYTGGSFTTGSETIDMSSAISAVYPSDAPPVGYEIIVQARDSASAASTTARIDLAKISGITSTRRSMLRIGGTPDDILIGETCYVEADANGDIYIAYFSSGANTLVIYLTVAAIYM